MNRTTDTLSLSMTVEAIEARLDNLETSLQNAALHYQTLSARIDDIRSELRTEGTRRALLTGLDKRRK